MSKFRIDRRELKKGYLLHKTATSVIICKILNEYETMEDAKNDLFDLLADEKHEVDLLKEFSKIKL